MLEESRGTGRVWMEHGKYAGQRVRVCMAQAF